jgi:hypothetical protein
MKLFIFVLALSCAPIYNAFAIDDSLQHMRMNATVADKDAFNEGYAAGYDEGFNRVLASCSSVPSIVTGDAAIELQIAEEHIKILKTLNVPFKSGYTAGSDDGGADASAMACK